MVKVASGKQEKQPRLGVFRTRGPSWRNGMAESQQQARFHAVLKYMKSAFMTCEPYSVHSVYNDRFQFKIVTKTVIFFILSCNHFFSLHIYFILYSKIKAC